MNDYDEILKYIQEEIIPEYPEIKSCKLHILPSNFKENLLFICEVPIYLFINEKKVLESNLLDDLNNSFDKSFVDRVNIIFIQF